MIDKWTCESKTAPNNDSFYKWFFFPVFQDEAL